MTFGNHYSKTARKAINRFYEHADTRYLTQLQELVSELYLAEGAKTLDKLWKKAAELLPKAGAPAERIAPILAARDVKAFAGLVGVLTKPR